MKNIILATVISLATASAAIAPTQAATVVVKTDNHMHRHMRMMKKHCHTKVVTTWRHHHKVTKEVKVCS